MAATASLTEELLLIDGNSLAYRAFFALPESIATSTGIPTNAIFGLASMLVKILTEYGQRPTVVVWDGGYTGRKELYPEYKAQRSSRPDLLKEQWPHFEPLIEAFGYRNLRVEGYEADDVIASIAELAKHAGEDGAPIPVMVLTGDRDAFQLVDDSTRIMAPGRGITDTKVYDTQGVIDRYGITPEQVPDFIGLKGDTSDNIPGVPGIGDKTAADLLQRFGSLETVLASVDEISGAKRKENLTEHADDARLSKQLATAKRDIPLDIDLHELDRSGAGPLEAARHLPPVRAARPAAPARGGARLGRGRRARTSVHGRCCRCCSGRATARSHRPRPHQAARGRRGHARGASTRRPPRARCSATIPSGASGSTRPAARCSSGICDGPAAVVDALGARAGGRARRQVAGRDPADARPRHRDRRLPARAGAAQLPVPRAGRGARLRDRDRRRCRRRRGADRPARRPGSARSCAAAA